jgi:hypothetical protein
MLLDRLTIVGYRCHANVQVELSDLTVLIGPMIPARPESSTPLTFFSTGNHRALGTSAAPLLILRTR